MGQWHKWTAQELDIVRREYAGSNSSAQAIAHKIGVSLFAVKGQVQKMGLAKITDRRKWSADEDNRLRELLDVHPPIQVARRMKRSVNSIVVRSKRLQISRRDRSGWYSKREVCDILGVGHKWVQRRIDDGSLPASSHYGGPVQQNGACMWHIKEGGLREFIRRYPQELNGRNVDLIAVVDILVGITALPQ